MGDYTSDLKNAKQYALKFNIRKDADIIAALEAQQNVQGYIKKLIRDDISRQMETADPKQA